MFVKKFESYSRVSELDPCFLSFLLLFPQSPNDEFAAAGIYILLT
jgi:hypothetical protein